MTFQGPAPLPGGGGACVENRAQGGNPNLTFQVDLPAGHLNFSPDTFILTLSSQFVVASGSAIPNGTVIGGFAATVRLALFANPCSNTVPMDFILYDSTIITGNVVLGPPSTLARDGGDGYPGKADANSYAVSLYPSITKAFFDPDGPGPTPSVVPRARYAGLTQVAGQWQLLQVVVFDPGALKAAFRIPGNKTHPFARLDAGLGWTIVVMLNDPLAATGTASAVTEFCSPLSATGMLLGAPGGVARLTSPTAVGGIDGQGTQLTQLYMMSLRDLDKDGIDNGLDSCPHLANTEDPYTSAGPDGDMLDSACDPTPASNTNAGDHDLDGFLNTQDNCPVVYNPSQTESESPVAHDTSAPDGGPWNDQMGDACDSEYGLGNSDSVANGAFLYAMHSDAFCINDTVGSDRDGDGWCGLSGGADPNDADPNVTGEPNQDADRDSPVAFPRDWTDRIESYVGTDPLEPCSVTPAGDAWPPDTRSNASATLRDRVVSGIDMLPLKAAFGTSIGQPGYNKRVDFDANGTISGLDELPFKRAYGTSCTVP